MMIRAGRSAATRALAAHGIRPFAWQAVPWDLDPVPYQKQHDPSKKGSQREPGRLDGLLPTPEDVKKRVDEHRNEEGVFVSPHALEFPYMTYKDVAVNYHIRARKFRPPPFGDAEYKQIEDKTTLNRDSVEYVRDMWCNHDIDNIDYLMVVDDILEMYKKGVPKRTINLWLNHVTGNGEHPDESLRNLNWTRIDS